MKRRSFGALAFAAAIAVVANGQDAFAQSASRGASKMAYQNRAANPAARANNGSPSKAGAKEMPAQHAEMMQAPRAMHGEQIVEGYPVDQYGYSDCGDGYCSDGGCYGGCDSGCYGYDSGCCDGCSHGGGKDWFNCCGSGSQFFFTADYLYVKASFSEATAFLEQEIDVNFVDRDFEQLDFDYESSYRFGGGWRRPECGDEIRFLYTRLQSSADEEVPFSTDILIPFEPGTPPGGRTLIDADVDVRSFDLECAKIIPLGGLCTDCCDPCDPCGGCCPPPCPLWELTWSGGVRVADASWTRSYTAVDQNDAFVGDGVSSMDFDGVGLKAGLEGRRYFGKSGWFSTYLKGDISVLWGELSFDAVRTIDGGTAPDNVIAQSLETEQLIPVTELEAGVSGQITCNSRVSAGYLLSAWHDLGFRDEFALGQDVFPLSYDDANILGFDGFFVRAEVAY